MQLSDQVCTLEQARQLEELGFKPKTHAFWWVYHPKGPVGLLVPAVVAFNSWEWCKDLYFGYYRVAALTASELAILLWPQIPVYSSACRLSEACQRANQLIEIRKIAPDGYSVAARLQNLEEIRYVPDSSCADIRLPADADRDADHFTSFPDYDGE